MKKVFYYTVSGIWYLLSLLPLRILYVVSDGLFYLIYYVVRYRRPVVRKNLTDSFPEKSEHEIIKIEKGFYSWFCDYIVETIKLFTMSKKQMMKRMTFEGVDMIQKDFNNGETCSMYLGHYCNWEWITSLPLHVDSGICAQIYHPLENKRINSLFLKLRSRFGAKNIEMDKSFRTIVSWKRNNIINIVGYIADQVPGLHNVHCWVDFLNHDTPVFTGAEKITSITNAKAYYGDIIRPKRGHYKCVIKRIDVPETEDKKFFITKEYFRLLEENINRAPQYWLWSHNRWKRTREDFNRLYTIEEQKRMLSRL